MSLRPTPSRICWRQPFRLRPTTMVAWWQRLS